MKTNWLMEPIVKMESNSLKHLLTKGLILFGVLSLVGLSQKGYSQPGDALDFDASSNQRIEISDNNSLDISGAITIEAWVKLDGSQNSNTVNPHIIRKGGASSNGNYFLIAEGGSGKVWFRVNDGTNEYNLKGTTDLRDNNWHHIAGVYNPSSGNQFVYVDGVQENKASPGSKTLQTNNIDLGFMFRPNNNDEYVNGELDEVRIWSEARTQTQIQKYMNQEVKDVSGKSNLEAYYRFDNSGNSTLTDETSNGNDGTVKNSPTWVNSNAVLESLGELGEQSSGSGAYNSDLAATWESNTSSTSDGLKVSENGSNTFSTSENVIFGSNGNSSKTESTWNANVDSQLSREWLFDVNASLNTKTVNLEFTTSDAGVLGLPSGINASDYVLIENDDPTGSSYSKLVTGASSVSSSSNTVSFDGVTLTEGNSYTLGTEDKTNSPLPVELTHFKAQKAQNQVRLNWATASETNNSHFMVQRKNGHQWENLGKVEGHGTTTEPREYKFRDQNPKKGTNYYRLKQVDFDGSFEYSNIKAVRLDASVQDALTILQNPVEQALKLRLQAASNGLYRYTLYRSNGNPVKSGAWQLTKGKHDLRLPMEAQDAGVYYLEVNHNQKRLGTKKILK